MSTKVPQSAGLKVDARARVAIVAARFNQEVVEELLRGCRGRLEEFGVPAGRVEVFRVPGAFELPVAAQWAARSGRFAAVICLGAVIRGETPHFEYVAGSAAAGVARVMLDESLPVVFGVLTVNNEKQAWDRCGGNHGHVGRQSAEVAVEMVGVRKAVGAKGATPARGRGRK